MKYFVISDVHGYYHEMITALYVNGFDINNPEHMLISCGDACDRGPDAVKVLEFLMDLYDDNRAILIRGNHEDLLTDAMYRGYFLTHDIQNGTTKTVCQLTGIEAPDEALEMMPTDLWERYSKACINYYEMPQYIFVHGWIPDVPDNDWRHAEEYDWKEARWFNGMKMWHIGFYEHGKTIVCGHFHTSWGHAYLHNDGNEFLNTVETYYIDPATGKQEPHANFDIFYDDGIIAIDACTALTKQVNVLVI